MALTGGNWRVMAMGGGHLKQRGFFPLSLAQVEVIALKELCLFPIKTKILLLSWMRLPCYCSSKQNATFSKQSIEKVLFWLLQKGNFPTLPF